MDDFVAYHSVERMGCEYKATDRLSFMSRKEAMLRKAIGNNVWVVQGHPNGDRKLYTLCGVYRADAVEPNDRNPGSFVITGRRTIALDGPVILNDIEWFPALFDSQNNFSLGFNRITNKEVLDGLRKIEMVQLAGLHRTT